MSTNRCLSAYRNLHRVIRRVFEGDMRMMTASRLKAKEEFAKNKDVTDPAEIDNLINVADEAAKFMYHELVQVKHDPNKNVYGTYLRTCSPRFTCGFTLRTY